MIATRWAIVLAFIMGSAGVAISTLAESWPLGLAGSVLTMGSVIVLFLSLWRRHWQKEEQRESQKALELSKAINELRGDRRLLGEIRAEVKASATRIDTFARGVLEYVAQTELDIQESIQKTEESLKQLDQQAIKHHDQLESAEESLRHLDRLSIKRRDQLLIQLDGVIGVYLTLKPRIPYPTFGGWAISGDCARRLVQLVLAHPPSWIIEVGSGLSTLLLAQALEMVGSEGRIVSLEHEKAYLDASYALLAEHGAENRVQLVHAPLVPVHLGVDGAYHWYDLTKAELPEKADLIFIDGPPKASGPFARYPALPLLLDRLSPTGVVLMDDAYRADEKGSIKRWEEEYPDLEMRTYPDSKGTVEIRRRPL